MTWLGAHEKIVLLALAGIVTGVWVFALLADEVVEGGTKAFDQKVLLSFRNSDTHALLGPPAAQDAARDITALGGVAVLTLVTAIAAGFLALDGKKHMALFVLRICIGRLGISTLLKELFQRPRPDLVPYSAYASGASFPSGHSMMSAVTYLTLGALLARSQERQTAEGVLFAGRDIPDVSRSASRACTWACIGRPTCWRGGRRARSGRCCAG